MPYAPDDLKTHLMHCLIQMIFVASHMTLQATGISIFFSFFFYIEAMCEDFRKIYDTIDEKLTTNAFIESNELKKLFLDTYKLEKNIIK